MTGQIVAVEVVAGPGADSGAIDSAIRAACADLPSAARPRNIRFVETVDQAGSKIVRRIPVSSHRVSPVSSSSPGGAAASAPVWCRPTSTPVTASPPAPAAPPTRWAVWESDPATADRFLFVPADLVQVGRRRDLREGGHRPLGPGRRARQQRRRRPRRRTRADLRRRHRHRGRPEHQGHALHEPPGQPPDAGPQDAARSSTSPRSSAGPATAASRSTAPPRLPRRDSPGPWPASSARTASPSTRSRRATCAPR